MATITSTTEDVMVAQQPLFTCLSCSIAFPSAEDQRVHYRSDHHRYNMKRRVASLPPVSAAVFNQKVLERRAETAIMSSSKGSTCEICGKVYTTENAYRSHINSKKHKENEIKAASRPISGLATIGPSGAEVEPHSVPNDEASTPTPVEGLTKETSLVVDDDASDDEVNQTIDAKIAAARSRLSPNNCLFCPETLESLADSLTHMSSAHSFFIPDAEYLVDLPGLITYLGEKIAVGNVCIYCNGKGRELRTLEAARKHMVDKSHCKIAYDSENDRLEVSDFYDFTTSYPDANKTSRQKKNRIQGPEDDWEDVDEDGAADGADEIVDESASEASEEDDLADNQLTYGDTPYELVLPSGARIGHRSMKRYYAQSFHGLRGVKEEDPNSGAALVRRLLADKNSALVPRKGGFGAHGQGTDVVKARNPGEAREAGRHVREFRDQKRREDFKTKVAFIHNSQKHFRDPLLQ
ncbi:hypothetical protein BV22DRAFT_1070593 [Leucogyrophana mollusca]|uniref:Uncharacterized protein n=1 Tax=Leucogyrophana mollusca TaxID=85980 RepID=A0ACB8B9L0_9AGAM|nr:hypothetical protein BV22DRAFT_1070593 [Leucogyrophana mollusca]